MHTENHTSLKSPVCSVDKTLEHIAKYAYRVAISSTRIRDVGDETVRPRSHHPRWHEFARGVHSYVDARKEFALTSMTGFGVDGDKTRRDEDFNAVRGGSFEENPFVNEVVSHMERKTALELSQHYGVDTEMIAVAAACHDPGLSVDRKTHHLESGRMIREMKELQKWFSPEQIEIIAQAAEDHRASSDHEPRTIYGKIIAEADRQIIPEVVIHRTIQYGLMNYPEKDREGHWQRTVEHLEEKYADGGYLKLWIPESANAGRLEELRKTIRDKEALRRVFETVYKEELYKDILPKVKSIAEGEDDMIANMANVTALLHRTFGFWWTGFYRVRGEELVLGPFQGPLACTRIPFGKGVCGSAWQREETIVVPDVEKFPGHIACSSESRSEIVVPVWKDGKITAVLDIDSEMLDTFDETDRKYLEEICQMIG